MPVKSIPARDTGTSLGHVPTLRWCFGCLTEKPMKGGSTRPVFFCAGCRPKANVKKADSVSFDRALPASGPGGEA